MQAHRPSPGTSLFQVHLGKSGVWKMFSQVRLKILAGQEEYRSEARAPLRPQLQFRGPE